MLSRPAVAVARAALRCPASIRGAQFATATALCGRPNRPAQQAPAASAWVQPLSSGRAFAAPVASLPAWAAGRSFSAAAANQLADIVTPNKAFVTKPAPYFGGKAVLPNGTFGQISLDDYKGKWVVLFSYPLDFTFVCPTEIIDYSNHAEEFKKINCEVVAFSVDSIFTHLAWVNTPRKAGGVGSLNIPLLSDDTHQISRDYGVLQAQGANLRGLWIIDPNGVVRHITINDPPVGRNPKETLRLVQAFQFVEKHGEVCPSGWTPGAETMKADPQGSKAYFEKVNQQ